MSPYFAMAVEWRVRVETERALRFEVPMTRIQFVWESRIGGWRLAR